MGNTNCNTLKYNAYFDMDREYVSKKALDFLISFEHFQSFCEVVTFLTMHSLYLNLGLLCAKISFSVVKELCESKSHIVEMHNLGSYCSFRVVWKGVRLCGLVTGWIVISENCYKCWMWRIGSVQINILTSTDQVLESHVI